GSAEHDPREPILDQAWTPTRAIESPSVAPDPRTFSEYQALPEEPPRAVYEEVQPEGSAPASHHDLSEEEVTSLAEQLAEARHEEVSAQAEADSELGLLEEEPPHAPE